jgi:hypothetical protein
MTRNSFRPYIQTKRGFGTRWIYFAKGLVKAKYYSRRLALSPNFRLTALLGEGRQYVTDQQKVTAFFIDSYSTTNMPFKIAVEEENIGKALKQWIDILNYQGGRLPLSTCSHIVDLWLADRVALHRQRAVATIKSLTNLNIAP